MSSTSSAESAKICDVDRSEGGLFLCESDLIGALLLSHHAAGTQPATLLPDVASVLLNLNGNIAVTAC